MGDFYELFFGDAEVASRALGIVLTKRGKHRGQDIPMCGVPVERADDYLHRLIALGHRVAVCEQIEDPAEARKRGGKSVVRRDVVRLVTPGTLTEDSLLDARRNNYLVAIARAKLSADGDSAFALAFLDISTGEFRLVECDRNGLPAELARLEPGEIIVSDALYGDTELAPLLRALPVTPLGRDVFDGASAERRLASYFAVATTDAFGALSRLELTAAAACVTYVERTQISKRPPLSPPTREAVGATLAIDAATRTNLELMRTQTGDRRGSLIGAIDRTVTVAGARLLSQRLAAPRSGAGSTPSSCFRPMPRCAAMSARGSPRRPISPARWHDWWWGAAVRAISPPFATVSTPRRNCGRGSPRPRRSPRSSRRWRRSTGPTRRSPQSLPRRSARSCRCSSATAASSGRNTMRRSTRRVRCAMNPAASSPRCRPAMPTAPRSSRSRSGTTTCSAISSRSPRSTATS
jgi:hypothetical protein